MKSSVFALVVIFALSATASSLAAQELSLGVEAGVNVADLDFENPSGDVPEVESRTGLRVGGVLHYAFARDGVLGFQTGLIYSQKGGEAVDGSDRTTLETDYVEVPLLLTARIPTGEPGISPRLFAGAQLAFEGNCDLDDETRERICEDEGIETKTTDFGLVFGGGLGWSAGPGVLTLDARYELGLTNLNDSEGFFDPGFEFRNRVWQLAAGYRFSL